MENQQLLLADSLAPLGDFPYCEHGVEWGLGWCSKCTYAIAQVPTYPETAAPLVEHLHPAQTAAPFDESFYQNPNLTMVNCEHDVPGGCGFCQITKQTLVPFRQESFQSVLNYPELPSPLPSNGPPFHAETSTPTHLLSTVEVLDYAYNPCLTTEFASSPVPIALEVDDGTNPPYQRVVEFTPNPVQILDCAVLPAIEQIGTTTATPEMLDPMVAKYLLGPQPFECMEEATNNFLPRCLSCPHLGRLLEIPYKVVDRPLSNSDRPASRTFRDKPHEYICCMLNLAEIAETVDKAALRNAKLWIHCAYRLEDSLQFSCHSPTKEKWDDKKLTLRFATETMQRGAHSGFSNRNDTPPCPPELRGKPAETCAWIVSFCNNSGPFLNIWVRGGKFDQFRHRIAVWPDR